MAGDEKSRVEHEASVKLQLLLEIISYLSD